VNPSLTIAELPIELGKACISKQIEDSLSIIDLCALVWIGCFGAEMIRLEDCVCWKCEGEREAETVVVFSGKMRRWWSLWGLGVFMGKEYATSS